MERFLYIIVYMIYMITGTAFAEHREYAAQAKLDAALLKAADERCVTASDLEDLDAAEGEVMQSDMTQQLLTEREVGRACTRKPYSQGVTDLQSLYAKNAEAEAEFHSLMRELHSELGGRLL